jgi:DNA-binding HxlR family transcriptional regulator
MTSAGTDFTPAFSASCTRARSVPRSTISTLYLAASSASKRADYQKLEDVFGCKWSVAVLQCVGEGINRPGALEREIEGISTKVLSERLRKLTAYGLLGKQTSPEVPPKTEYALTDSGIKLLAIINQIRVLDEGIKGGTGEFMTKSNDLNTEEKVAK